MGDASETYPLARDSTESTRVWLLEARDLLNSEVPNKEQRTFHGFDISAAQFPDSPPEDVSFSCQDILKPFPPEHHGKYDLVHVRLLVTAFPEKEYETAVRNLMEILKPGGFIQWTDLDCAFLSSPTSTDLTDPRSSFLASTWLKFLESNSLAVDAPAALAETFKRAGLADVRITGYAQHDRDQALKIRAQKWQAGSLATIVERLLRKNGTGEVDAKTKVEAEVAKLWEYFEDGGRVLGIRLGVVVGRKAA
ncbi:hypothetical protein BDW71DRAFT_198150 [Aspergillus fruticulosus]